MFGKMNLQIVYFQKNRMHKTESVVAWLPGWFGDMMGKGDRKQINGNLIVTQERVAFLSKGLFGETFESMMLKQVTSIETSSTMNFRVLRLHTANDEMQFKTFAKKQVFNQTLESIDRGRNSNDIQIVSDEDEKTIEMRLKELKQLHQQNLISDIELSERRKSIIDQV